MSKDPVTEDLPEQGPLRVRIGEALVVLLVTFAVLVTRPFFWGTKDD